MSDENSIAAKHAQDDGDDYQETVDCWDCGGEMYTHHNCGEDVCCCADPQPNVRCETCEGKGFLEVNEP